ncbi:MAG: nucleotidyltransferase domain-containing protein [Deltaproteobacteria bacterium]|nr:nucleotidyltransferase domain-containing protein [Deltaproteobacteria bacterium]
MRLSLPEQKAICDAIHRADSAATVFLYGSRVRDDLKGGDIDLLVLSETISFGVRIQILSEIKEQIGEQKIDLLVKTPQQAATDPFVTQVLLGAVKLEERL